MIYKTVSILFFSLSFVALNAQHATVPVTKVDGYIKKQMQDNHIPGLSIAVVWDGKVILSKGYGQSNLELSTPVTSNSVFAIYSITKTFTAVATMMLVEEGKVSLEDPVTKHIPGLPDTWRKINIRHLLTHTSGLIDICDVSPDPCHTSRDYTQQEIVKLVTDSLLRFVPGEKWEYSNIGYFLLGMLIEKKSGMSYGNFLRERIFMPLNMQHTMLQDYSKVISNRVNGYTWTKDGYRNSLQVSPTLSFSLAGLVSTVLDLAKYDAALYTEKLFKRSTLEQMWTRTFLNNGQIVDHGLGFGMTPFRGHRRVGHSGGHTGFATTITRLVDDKITVIIFTNADSNGYKSKNGFLISDIANEIASFYFNK